MSDTGAVERAAREAYPIEPGGVTDVRAVPGIERDRRAFERGYRAALAAAAPTVEQYRDLLTRHTIGDWDREGRCWCPCAGFGADVLVFATRKDAIAHQAAQVAALWGAR